MFEPHYTLFDLIQIGIFWGVSLGVVYWTAKRHAKKSIAKMLLNEINRKRRAKYADRVD